MQTPFIINNLFLTPTFGLNHILHMGKRFAFLICVEGCIDIEIMNQQSHVESCCIMACLPFANIKIINVSQPSEIIFVEINRENIIGLSPAHRSIISNNLSFIRQQPIGKVKPEDIVSIKRDIQKYLREVEEKEKNASDETRTQIFKALIEARSQLITSMILKLLFADTSKERLLHGNQDYIFHNFMIDLYDNYKRHHNVKFYAVRSGLSQKYFSTIIRKLSGATPSEWIESTILGEAQTMLHDPHYTIKDIAIALHFSDSSTFSRYIYRVTGMTPKNLRKTLIK